MRYFEYKKCIDFVSCTISIFVHFSVINLKIGNTKYGMFAVSIYLFSYLDKVKSSVATFFDRMIKIQV